MTYQSITEIKVGLDFGNDPMSVGRLVIHNNQIYFEYDASFLKKNLALSPFRLPIESGLKTLSNDRY